MTNDNSRNNTNSGDDSRNELEKPGMKIGTVIAAIICLLASLIFFTTIIYVI